MALFLCHTLTPRYNRTFTFFCVTALFSSGIWWELFSLPMAFKPFVTMPAMLCACCLFFSDRLPVRLLFPLSMITACALLETVLVQICTTVLHISYDRVAAPPLRQFLVAILLLLLFPCFWLLSRLFRPVLTGGWSLSNWTGLAFLLFPLSQLMMMINYEITLQSLLPDRIDNLFFMCSVLICIASDCFLLRTLDQLNKGHLLRMQMQEVESTMRLQQQEYKSLLLAQESMAKYRHDSRNFAMTLSRLLASDRPDAHEKALELLHAETAALEAQSTRAYCGNSVVNAVLNAKQAACDQAQTQLVCDVLLPDDLPFDALTLCSAFSNLLDNAMRAVSILPVPQRKITLTARVDGGYFFLKVCNPRDPNPKNTPRGQGLGLQILQQLADTHNGDLHTVPNGSSYTATLCLKISAVNAASAPPPAGA